MSTQVIRSAVRPTQYGTTMLEVLVAIIILAFGLLGLSGLEGKVQQAEVESFQRAQALVLLNDMVDRIKSNPATAATYVSGSVFGTGLVDASPCPTAAGSARDQCEWSVALKGAAETKSSVNLGAMGGARGCISLVQAANPAAGVCTPGIYLVTVAWQGLRPTVTPSAACGATLYGANDSYRRAVSARIVIGLPQCS